MFNSMHTKLRMHTKYIKVLAYQLIHQPYHMSMLVIVGWTEFALATVEETKHQHLSEAFKKKYKRTHGSVRPMAYGPPWKPLAAVTSTFSALAAKEVADLSDLRFVLSFTL